MDEASRRAIARDLANAVAGEVRFGLHDRMLYATDASLYQVEPIGVVIPASVDDAWAAARFCLERGIAVLPRGGGTSLAGQCTAEAVVIDFSANCRAVLEVDARGQRVVVEPGITVDELNEELARRGTGLFFAPDPATSRQANIGGCIGNNAAGSHSIRYGRTSESVIAIEAGLASGERVWLREGAAWLRTGGTGVSPVIGRGYGEPSTGGTPVPQDYSRTDGTPVPQELRGIVRELTLRTAKVVQRHAALIRERFPKTVRRNAGYGLDMILAQMDSAGARADADEVLRRVNLAHLLCGSEGTLAVTLGAELALHPVPMAKGLALVGFDSLDEAVAAVVPILASGPVAVELIDDTIIELALKNAEYSAYARAMPGPVSGRALGAVLYVEYYAERDRREIDEKFAVLRGLLSRSHPGAGVACLTEAGSIARAWKLRKAGEPLLHGLPGKRKPITFVEDNAVPPERLVEFVREFKALVSRHGTRAAFWAHASVGVLHIRPFLDIRDPGDEGRMHAIAVEAADLAKRLGGVMSGEHGDGRVRGPLLERYFGPELMRAFREVKAIWDPRNLLNPGNIVEPGPIESISERTRVRPDVSGGREMVRVAEAATFFEYEDQHGFGGAVEMCNGAGVCRKKSGGVMCPSYMATLDERHSTRGRGNALRLAITGQMGKSEAARERGNEAGVWNDPETMATLDLCLSCKACKAECPSNVDIARLKAEYTAQRYRASGRVPVAAYLTGHVRVLNRIGSLAPGLANWFNSTRVARAVIDRVMGVHPGRSLPLFSRALFGRVGEFVGVAEGHGGGRRGGGEVEGVGKAGRGRLGEPTYAKRVVLFGDCFTAYSESDIGVAAGRVLSALGYRVEVPRVGCCGRSMISVGMLEQAIEAIDATLDRLRAFVEDESVEAIVVAEPSCLSAMRDDWLQLRLRTPMEVRKGLAAKAMLPEEFVESAWDRHPRPVEEVFDLERMARERAVLHGHCHQKAVMGIDSSAALLRRLLGGNLQVPDTGCCGMAGSFGFARHRYELSMRIGELSVFPAARSAAESGATMLATGTSCRHQIHDGTGTRAVHPIECLAAWLH